MRINPYRTTPSGRGLKARREPAPKVFCFADVSDPMDLTPDLTRQTDLGLP